MGDRRFGNYSSCCRLCLLDNFNTLKPIFDDANGGPSLVAKILSFLGIEVTVNDKVSTMICESCLLKINTWDLFKEQCFDNQTKLQDWLKNWNQNNSGDTVIQIKDEPIDQNVEDDRHAGSNENTDDDDLEVVIKNEPAEDHMEEDIFVDVSQPLDRTDDEDSQISGTNAEVASLSEISIFRTPKDARKCMYCSKTFSTPGNRRKHEKIMHEMRGRDTNHHRYSDMNVDDASQNSIDMDNSAIEVDPFASENDRNNLSPNNESQDGASNDADYQKIQFAGALQLQQANGTSKFPTIDSSLTNVENCYIDKCKKMIMMFNTLVCLCHGIQHKSIKRLFAHLRSVCHWFPVYTCYNCMITFVDRSSVMRHNSKCQKRQLENLIRLSTLRSNSDMKIRLYQSYKCLKCMYTFNFYEDYCDHIDNEHIVEEPPYNCICGTIYENVDDYQQHLHTTCLLHFYCDICFEMIPTMEEFKKHVEEVHDSSEGFVFLPVQGLKTERMEKMEKAFEISLNSLNSSQDDTLNSTDHEVVECAPDLEIGGYEDYVDQSYPPPPPPPKKWNSRSTCTICGNTYSNYHNMMRHFKTHGDSEKTIPCDHCDEMFRLKSQLKEHLVIVHGILDTKNALRYRMEQTNYPCPECNIIFSTLDEWTKHKRTHPMKTCNECGKQFSFQTELDQHRSVHLNLKVYRDSKTHSYKTTQVSPSPVDLICQICNQTFSTIQDLQEHTTLHNITPKMEPMEPEEMEEEQEQKPKKYSCETCNKHYVGYGGLWEHNKRYHPERRTSKDYPRQCKYCDKVLQTGGAYYMHKQMHERLLTPLKGEDEPRVADDEDYFTCKRCFKVFSSKYNLKNHMKCHGINLNSGRNPTGKGGKFKTYWCNICHQACQGYMELQSHKQEHEVEKMNEMKEMNQMNQVNDIKHFKNEAVDMEDDGDELLAYNGEEEMPEFNEELEVLKVREHFTCDICGQDFSSKLALKKHKEKHDEELPPTQKHTYVYCKYCKIPFISVDKLNEHMEIEHDEIPGRPKPKPPVKTQKYPCNLCKKVFDTTGALCSHQGWHKRIRAGEKSKVLLKQVLKDFPPRPQPKFQCKSCSQQFINDTALQIHILEAHRNINASVVIPRCTQCDLEFESQAAFEKHNQLHKIVEKQKDQHLFYCKHCNAGFSRVDGLHSHVKQYHRDRNQNGHACPVCNRVFERPQALATHVKIHERDRFQTGPPKPPKVPKAFLYSCSICHVGFNVPKELRNHIITNHPF